MAHRTITEAAREIDVIHETEVIEGRRQAAAAIAAPRRHTPGCSDGLLAVGAARPARCARCSVSLIAGCRTGGLVATRGTGRPRPRARSIGEESGVLGTHTGDGSPVAPTGKRASAGDVYVMDFEGDRIGHMTKIWNSGFTLGQLGWV